MTKRTVLAVFLGLSLGGASAAHAQSGPSVPPEFYVNVSVGAQTPGHTVNSASTFTLYDEEGKLDSTYRSRSAVIVDIAGGHRIWRSMSVGAAYTEFSKSSTGETIATVPNPLFFDQPVVTGTIGLGELEHKEHGLHVNAAWWIPISDKIDIAISVGPSFIFVTQEVATLPVVEDGTQNVTGFLKEKQSGTAFGVNVGFDGTYLFTPRFGAGLLVRYAGGSVDLPNLKGLTVGGFQIGLGIRMRF